MLEAMNVTDASWPTDLEAAMNALQAGHAFEVPDVLFAKISDDRRVELEEQFAGQG
jgi:methionyl-tRNA synthetase